MEKNWGLEGQHLKVKIVIKKALYNLSTQSNK